MIEEYCLGSCVLYLLIGEGADSTLPGQISLTELYTLYFSDGSVQLEPGVQLEHPFSKGCVYTVLHFISYGPKTYTRLDLF